MSLKNLAQHLAAHGRGNDKMLMHVTPAEVAGLQSIAMAAGGRLSVNPHTGLPEAGFFEDFLPTILGTVAGFATGNPYIGATVAGASETAKSGNLLSGVMTGLTAFGMQGLGQTLANTGANTASQAANAATQAGQAGGVGLTLPAGAADAVSGLTGAGKIGFSAPASSVASNIGSSVPGIGDIASGIGGGASKAADLFTMSNPAKLNMSNILSGVKGVFQPGGLDAFKTAGGAAGAPLTGKEMISRIAAPVYGLGLMGSQTTPEKKEQDYGDYVPLSEVRKRYGYAMGGDVDTSRQQINFDMRNKPMGERNDIDGGYAKGGYLNGDGDGMSDSIPATIEGKQPARLADGEFVIPADVVSHLGNGSTKAGAQRLYEMMSRVRKARTGNHKQGKQINPNKFIPT